MLLLVVVVLLLLAVPTGTGEPDAGNRVEPRLDPLLPAAGAVCWSDNPNWIFCALCRRVPRTALGFRALEQLSHGCPGMRLEAEVPTLSLATE